MSRYKIVKKHGRLEKHKFRRCPPHNDIKQTILNRLFPQGHLGNFDENSIYARLTGPDFIVWVIFLALQYSRRCGRLDNVVKIKHEGRGLSIQVGGGWGSEADTQIPEVLREHWQKFKGWDIGYAIRVEAVEGMVIWSELTLYPAVGTITYNVCKRLYAIKGSVGFGNESRVMDEFLMASDEELAHVPTFKEV
jgi:hypothetical protein